MPSSDMSVTAILQEQYEVTIHPGSPGTCPFCQHKTFSLKADDTLAKCFHPTCGQFVTPSRDGRQKHTLGSILEAIYHDCHQALLTQKSGRRNAYTYLTGQCGTGPQRERGIHAKVVDDAMIGVVPSNYDVPAQFVEMLAELDSERDTATEGGRAKKTARGRKALEAAEKRVQWALDIQQKLVDRFHQCPGWVCFFYTNEYHRIVSIHFRQPYAKKFASFKPTKSAGVFGRELFSPYCSEELESLNDYCLVTEGEFNTLQLQSLAIRCEQGYVNSCAVGSASGADFRTIQRVSNHPVICYDNDSAGQALVEQAQQHMTVTTCTTPETDSDLDDYIRAFGAKTRDAWQAVQQLVTSRQTALRVYSGTGDEFFESNRFIPKRLGDAIQEYYEIRFTMQMLWVYRDGVYQPDGEAVVQKQGQDWLGERRKEAHLTETLRYIEVATRLHDEPPPNCQYINLLNGRLDWATRDLEPHTAACFTTVQLPVEYDDTAKCLAFDNYLSTTFDIEVIPLIEEILGWCLLPDVRFQKAVMLTGEGENGKSVFLDLIGDLLGDANVANVALHDLEDNRFRAAELYGKLANIFADLDERGLKSSTMFKTLTTGDRVTAERKHTHPFTFRSYAKLLFSANKIPASRDRTHAFYRRWLIIPFTRIFNGAGDNPNPDKGLRKKLQEELPGILNRALQGLERLVVNDGFTQPGSVIEAKEAYVKSNDNVRTFVAECVVQEKTQSIEKQQFYQVYTSWCKSYGDRAVKQKVLKETLRQIIPTIDEWRPDKKAKWRWLGIDWNKEAHRYLPEQESHESF